MHVGLHLTFATLLERQALSIRSLGIERFKGKCMGFKPVTWLQTNSMSALRLTALTSADVDDGWLLELLTRHGPRMKYLRLGIEQCIAEAYSAKGIYDRTGDQRGRFTQTLMFKIKAHMAAMGTPDAAFCPESLILCGIDFHSMGPDAIEPMLDFSKLGTLSLESCGGLFEAFSMLHGFSAALGDTSCSLHLHTFKLRYEYATEIFMSKLLNFLLSLNPLRKLYVLLEGSSKISSTLANVLTVHGMTLKSLIWDQRQCARTMMAEDGSVGKHRLLGYIAKYCKNLSALGISLDWHYSSASYTNQAKVGDDCSWLRCMNVLIL